VAHETFSISPWEAFRKDKTQDQLALPSMLRLQGDPNASICREDLSPSSLLTPRHTLRCFTTGLMGRTLTGYGSTYLMDHILTLLRSNRISRRRRWQRILYALRSWIILLGRRLVSHLIWQLIQSNALSKSAAFCIRPNYSERRGPPRQCTSWPDMPSSSLVIDGTNGNATRSTHHREKRLCGTASASKESFGST